MSRVVQCPVELQGSDFVNPDVFTLFLAGGITSCPQWQPEIIARFKELDDNFVMLNPRRNNFDAADPAMGHFQVEWEDRHLSAATAILFWFPFETLCPITLFELAKYATKGYKIFVGCHPAYARKFDVEKQLSLMRPDVTVHDNFTPLVEDVINWYTDFVEENRSIAGTASDQH